jgi:hypothetical protein
MLSGDSQQQQIIAPTMKRRFPIFSIGNRLFFISPPEGMVETACLIPGDGVPVEWNNPG